MRKKCNIEKRMEREKNGSECSVKGIKRLRKRWKKGKNQLGGKGRSGKKTLKDVDERRRRGRMRVWKKTEEGG